jgi:selenide,water dikinase
MAAASGVTIAVDSRSLPIIEGVLGMVSQNRSGGMNTNREHFAPGIAFEDPVPDDLRDLMFDPQTSGGLLVAIAPESAAGLAMSLSTAGIPAVFVGDVVAAGAGHLLVG